MKLDIGGKRPVAGTLANGRTHKDAAVTSRVSVLLARLVNLFFRRVRSPSPDNFCSPSLARSHRLAVSQIL